MCVQKYSKLCYFFFLELSLPEITQGNPKTTIRLMLRLGSVDRGYDSGNMSVGTEDRTATINGRPVPLVSLTTSSDWLSLIICQVLLWVQLWLSCMQKVFAILKPLCSKISTEQDS